MLIFWIFVFANVFRLAPISFFGNDNNHSVQEGKSVGNDYNRSNGENENVAFEEIKIWHNGATLDPFSINLKEWWNYKIIITPTSNGVGCMSTQVIPKLSSKASYILAGVPIIYEMKNAQVWVYKVVCASMWMQQGEIVVE